MAKKYSILFFNDGMQIDEHHADTAELAIKYANEGIEAGIVESANGAVKIYTLTYVIVPPKN